MSFFGKTYVYEGHEKFDEFLKSAGLTDEEVAKYLQAKPTSKVEKDGDSYVYTTVSPGGPKVVKFQSGVEFDDTLRGGPIKTVYTVDGNKITQVIKSDKGTGTFVREYSDDKLVVTITSSTWDGTAKTFYKV
ncbi:unnamed protein product [Arctia plantaginis]|uniref:Lipocalin/cytosolic fatty-acid binding domain-containing protein n=1 Tax=Arctia plantaginis TaxID=874455 RepID=A0A8S0YQY3_ARCPL|nr:unnamed protein product [Arctia plantaginis]